MSGTTGSPDGGTLPDGPAVRTPTPAGGTRSLDASFDSDSPASSTKSSRSSSPRFKRHNLRIRAVSPDGSFSSNDSVEVSMPVVTTQSQRMLDLRISTAKARERPPQITPPKPQKTEKPAAVPHHLVDDKSFKTIDDRNPFVRTWDVILCIALGVTATVTPYEAAFIPLDLNYQGITDPILFWINRIMDLYFIADVVLSFFRVAVVDSSSFATPKLTDNARNYAKSWLTVDFISSIPFDFIIWSIAQESLQSGNVVSFVDLLSAEMLAFLRVLRLLKLLRLFRAAKILRRLRDRYGMSYRVTALASSFATLFWCCHLFACGWKLISDLSSDASIDTWLFQVGLLDAPHFEQYTTSFYWGMMTLTTTGYGNIPPGNDVERFMACIAMLLGAYLFTQLISRVNGSGTSEATARYRTHRDHLNDLLKLAKCDTQQSIKIRKFFRHSFCRIQHQRNVLVLSQMSQRQKGTFVQTLYCTALAQLSVFQDPPKSAGPIVRDRHVLFINAISEKLVARVYPAFEQLVTVGEMTTQPTCNMYVIRRGLLGSAGRVFRVNQILGEDIVCTNFVRSYAVNALTFVSTLTLSSHDLHSILAFKSFEYHRRRTRKAGIIIALKARLKNLSMLVRMIRSMAALTNIRAEVQLADLFDQESQELVVASQLQDRFRVESRPIPDSDDGSGAPKFEKVLCMKPKYRGRTFVSERSPTEVSTRALIEEVKSMDLDELTPEEAQKKLHFYQRVRTHLLHVNRRKEAKRLAAAQAALSRQRRDSGIAASFGIFHAVPLPSP